MARGKEGEGSTGSARHTASSWTRGRGAFLSRLWRNQRVGERCREESECGERHEKNELAERSEKKAEWGEGAT